MNAFVITGKNHEHLDTPVFHAGASGDQEAIAVFTQHALAAQYIADAGWADEYCVGELRPIQLVRWLAIAHDEGTNMVVVNPNRHEHMAGVGQRAVELDEPFGAFAELLSSEFIAETEVRDATQTDTRFHDELKALLESTLLNDPRLSSQPIAMEIAENGLVTLNGAVQSYRRKLLAQQIITCYEGVTGVVNNLSVTPCGATSDDETANNVRTALNTCADVTKETVQVSVTGGKVTLKGTVGSVWEQAVAEDVARGVRGVRDVNNLLSVNRDTKIADEELANAIKAALRRGRGLADTELSVAVAGNAVTLSGRVRGLRQREVAESVARQFGLIHTYNEIEVVGSR